MSKVPPTERVRARHRSAAPRSANAKNVQNAARVTPQSSAQTCAESHLKSCAHQHLTDVCVAVFDVHAAPSSVQMTDLSETKVRLLVHETTPACMLNLHLHKFGASGWDVLFHFPGATPPTKSQERTILGVSHGVWPSSTSRLIPWRFSCEPVLTSHLGKIVRNKWPQSTPVASAT